MSAPTVDKAKVAEKNGEAPKSVLPYEGPDTMAAALLQVLTKRIGEYRELDSKLAAASGDEAKARTAFIENSTDPNAVKLREVIAKAKADLEKLADKSVQTVKMSEDERKKLSEELKLRREKVRKAIKATRDSAEVAEVDEKGVNAALDEIGDPTRGKHVTGAKTGSGLPRASVNVKVEGKDLNQEFETFSALVKALEGVNVTFDMDNHVEEIQLSFAKAAGVDPAAIKTVDKNVTFDFKGYKVHTTPKERAARGSKKAA